MLYRKISHSSTAEELKGTKKSEQKTSTFDVVKHAAIIVISYIISWSRKIHGKSVIVFLSLQNTLSKSSYTLYFRTFYAHTLNTSPNYHLH